MKEITITRKAAVRAVVVAVGFVVVLLICIAQRVAIGQTYQLVRVGDEIVGYVTEQTNVKEVYLQARREVSLERGERLSMEFDWSSEDVRNPFQRLMSKNELKEAFKGMITGECAGCRERVYTVAIDGYRANFRTIEEVETFLNRVKEPVDGSDAYEARVYASDNQVGGILTAVLVEKEAGTEAIEAMSLGQMGTATPEAGVSAQLTWGMQDALAGVPEDESYQTGVLDMNFVELVEVFESYVDPSEISDIDEQVIEVTKEKESNKIYVVESGDCLSVIAMDHDTTVASIVALNDMSSADQMIRAGQELIIAVPEPDLQIRLTVGEVYEEDYSADPIIIANDNWYTTKEVVHEEGTVGHRERNDLVVYENGMEVSRVMVAETVMEEPKAAVIERGTIIPPTYIKPISGGRFTSGFGRRWGRMHKGVDWACPTGTTVFASCGGTVIQASYSGGYGNNVVIQHPDGRLTRYAHNSKLLVRVGQHVEQGQPIALSGSTGNSTGPHVHFEIYINGSAVNPLNYISN